MIAIVATMTLASSIGGADLDRAAVAMYRSRGYREVAPFNDEVHADHWFEKRLAPADEPT
jgi:hypothetical protein